MHRNTATIRREDATAIQEEASVNLTPVVSDDTLPSEELVRQLLINLGEDAQREGLLKTPERVAKALAFLTSGYQADIEEIVNGALFKAEGSQMVLVKDIEFHSMCEHHILPVEGKVHVAYLPSDKVVGLSKIPRIIDVFARRLQLQERMTNQIAHAIGDLLDARGVAVVVQAEHFCMKMRGVQKQCSDTITACYLGEFETNRDLRNEFLGMVQHNLR